MDLFSSLALGFSVAFDPVNILYCFLGVLLGTLVGVLPGIGPTATIAMLLPITFSLNAETALIMLAGIYYGAQYGGSTTAILINLPGESSSAVTAIDASSRCVSQNRKITTSAARNNPIPAASRAISVQTRISPTRCTSSWSSVVRSSMRVCAIPTTVASKLPRDRNKPLTGPVGWSSSSPST